MENFETSGKSCVTTNDHYLKLEVICIRSCRKIYILRSNILRRFLMIIKNLVENSICFSFYFDLDKSSFKFFDTKRMKRL